VLIDCETCSVRGIACPDCVVSVLLQAPPGPTNAVDLDESERNAVSVFAASGLLPPLRLVRPQTLPEHQRPDRRRDTA
jgi:hypothetical protein